MKKGAKARKCHICGKIVMWVIPQEVTPFCVLCEAKNTKDYGGNDGKGYICKECKAKQESL